MHSIPSLLRNAWLLWFLSCGGHRFFPLASPGWHIAWWLPRVLKPQIPTGMAGGRLGGSFSAALRCRVWGNPCAYLPGSQLGPLWRIMSDSVVSRVRLAYDPSCLCTFPTPQPCRTPEIDRSSWDPEGIWEVGVPGPGVPSPHPSSWFFMT